MGSLVVRSQSKAQESGMRIIGLELVNTTKSVIDSNMRNNIIIIMISQVKRQLVSKIKGISYFDILQQLKAIREFIISNKMSQQEQPIQGEQMEQEYDDLGDLQLFHSSSLRDPVDPPLEPLAVETYQLKRTYGPDNAQFYNQYEVIGQLGRGAFGQVLRVKRGTEQFAMKINNTKGLQKQRFFAADGQFANCLDVLKNQLNILKRLKHKNIGRCFEIIYGSDKICTINDLGTFGQIMDWRELDDCYKRNPKVVQYIGAKYKTTNLGDITRLVFIEVCEAIKYLHDHNITNRDIKVDNILCRETQGVGDQILVVDFTTVRYKDNDDISYFPTGTPGFRGPEHQFASSEGYSCKATDAWAVGIAMWVFFHQKLPFQGQNDLERDISAKNKELQFAEDCPQIVVDVIKKMTRKEWKDRISISQALDILQKSQ